ncbi:uncharacterized protein RSE6_04275 [Rhynchosporium secalis]|uniref:MHYT domain-containing protein n=1 Tax=Rhynchosporium secalis TaxID=38038 RepID=A0A1E1M6B7_RHYSE|nr:uncharacterized protein RSE6_04275 [Rhynchosporium secalis]
MPGKGPMPEEIMALQGEIVSKTYKAGYVFLSYSVSCLGAFTTLEIMKRRAASNGSYNNLLLLAASLSMGGITTWCMHFIGDCAIVLGKGQPEIQWTIAPGLTIVSFFVPVIIQLIALLVAGSNEGSIPCTFLGGILAGLGAGGMHYLGQYSLLNYDCTFDVGLMVGATILAIVASVVALLAFFMLRAAWHTSWWKRALCAVVLASGISGMHWIMSIGTSYRLNGWDPDISDNFSKSTVVTVIIVMSLDDVFGVSHPVFQWLFRASRNWRAISHLFPGMRRHLIRTGIKARMGSLDDAALFKESGTPINDYSIVFRELFCLAVTELGADLHQPIERLGVLYDEVITTGLGVTVSEKGQKSIATMASSLLDLERDGNDGSSLGKGQLLFLVSRAERFQVERLEAIGFRFAHPSSVNIILSNSLKVGSRVLARHLEVMRTYYTDHHILEPGIHLGCFAIRASIAVGRRGFDILVRRDAKNQLPTMQAPFDLLEPWHIEYLNSMDAKTVSVLGKQLHKDSKPSNKDAKRRKFAKDFLRTLEALKEEIEDPLFSDSMLISRPFEIPCRSKDKDSPPGVALMIAFRIILPLHCRAPGRKLTFTPLDLFKTQQRVYENSRDHVWFAKSIYREFVPLLEVERSYTEDYDDKNTSARPSSIRSSTATEHSRNNVSMGEYVDMYGNQLPEQFSKPYCGASKVRFWDRPRSVSKRRSENLSEQSLPKPDPEHATNLTTPEQQMKGGNKSLWQAHSSAGSSIHSPTRLLTLVGKNGYISPITTPLVTPAVELLNLDLPEIKPRLSWNVPEDSEGESPLYALWQPGDQISLKKIKTNVSSTGAFVLSSLEKWDMVALDLETIARGRPVYRLK